MKNFSRREAMKTIIAGSVAVTAANPALADSITAPLPPTTAMAFRGGPQPKPLPFDPAKLKGISEKLMRSHSGNNDTGAVKALNAVEQRLDVMLKDKHLPPYIYGDVKREELIRTGSVVLHENYFGNLGGDGKAGGQVLELINKHFGSFATWETEFKKTANA